MSFGLERLSSPLAIPWASLEQCRAEGASLMLGDILVGSKEQRFRFLDDLQNAIDEAPGALLGLNFYRAGEQKLRQVVVQLLPERLNQAA
jgi:hypothetical protein